MGGVEGVGSGAGEEGVWKGSFVVGWRGGGEVEKEAPPPPADIGIAIRHFRLNHRLRRARRPGCGDRYSHKHPCNKNNNRSFHPPSPL